MARGKFKPEKQAKNTTYQSLFNSTVSTLRQGKIDDSAKDDAWAKTVVQRDWENPDGKNDTPTAASAASNDENGDNGD